MATRGRNICNTLKAIRKQIADANGIEYSPEECHFKGECKGTCPKCEQDVRDLEHELHLRQMAGKAIKVAGVALGITAMTACSQVQDSLVNEPSTQTNNNQPINQIVGDVIEEMPSFPGGKEALMKYLANNTKWPNLEGKDSIEGRVIIGFTVRSNGSIENIKVMRSLRTDYDEEALNVVKKMPNWNPGKLNGSNVEVKYTLPIVFKK